MKRWFAALAVLCVGAAGAAALGHGRHQSPRAVLAKMEAARPAPLKRAAATVANYKAQALKAGKYRCCLKHPCDWCALHMGQCPCDSLLDSGRPVCNECKGGWYAGDGEAKGKKPDQIKTFPRG